MAFRRETNTTKDAIGDFEIIFFVPGANNIEGVQSGRLNAQILLSNGNVQTESYNLLTRLQDDAEGQQHLQNLIALRDYIKSRLNNEVLPT